MYFKVTIHPYKYIVYSDLANKSLQIIHIAPLNRGQDNYCGSQLLVNRGMKFHAKCVACLQGKQPLKLMLAM